MPVPAARVVQEARRWIGTPYHHRADIRGAGADCARMPIRVYADAGVITWFDPGDYPPDWYLHSREERYLGHVIRFADEVAPGEPILPADFAIWKFALCYAHGGIVTRWPMVVHAYAGDGIVEEGDASLDSPWTMFGRKPRPFKVFRPWGVYQ